jgi:hypothetical protein
LISNSEVHQLIIFGGNVFAKIQYDCIEFMLSLNNFKARMVSASHRCSMVQHSSSTHQTFIEFQLKVTDAKCLSVHESWLSLLLNKLAASGLF